MPLESKFLHEYLGECLQVERSAVELYEGAIARCKDEAMRRQLTIFKDQTVRHVEIVQTLITHAGANLPTMKEAMSTMLGKLTSGLSSLQGTGAYQQWKDLDNLLVAEYKDQSNWQILKTVGVALNDRVFLDAVNEVLSQEDAHVAYLEEAVLRLAPKAMATV